MVDLDIAVRILSTVELVEVEPARGAGRAVCLYRQPAVLVTPFVRNVLDYPSAALAVRNRLLVHRAVRDVVYVQGVFGNPLALANLWLQLGMELIERGVMKAAGLREVERAKADGRWDAAYDSPRTAAVPADLLRELEKNNQARKFFYELDSRNRYAVLYQIQDAKRPETRARRIAKYVAMLAEQKKPYP